MIPGGDKYSMLTGTELVILAGSVLYFDGASAGNLGVAGTGKITVEDTLTPPALSGGTETVDGILAAAGAFKWEVTNATVYSSTTTGLPYSGAGGVHNNKAIQEGKAEVDDIIRNGSLINRPRTAP